MGVMKAQGLKLPFEPRKPLIWAAAAVVLAVAHAAWFDAAFGYPFTQNNGISLTTHISSYFIIVWLFSDQARAMYKRIATTRFATTIVEVGKLSFFIYLTHCYFICAITGRFLPDIWIVRSAATVVISFAFAKIAFHFCPDRLKRIIGF